MIYYIITECGGKERIIFQHVARISGIIRYNVRYYRKQRTARRRNGEVRRDQIIQ